METDRETIYKLMNEIRETVKANENTDGSFRFDSLRLRIALEFVQLELEKSIEAYRS